MNHDNSLACHRCFSAPFLTGYIP